MRQPRPVLLEDLRRRQVRLHRRLLDARAGLRGDGRLLYGRDLRSGRLPWVELSSVGRSVQRHEGLLCRELRGGPVSPGDVHHGGRSVHDGLRVLRGLLRADGHLSFPVPDGERGLHAADGLLRGAALRDGHLSDPGLRVSPDERDVRELDAVLLGAVLEWAM